MKKSPTLPSAFNAWSTNFVGTSPISLKILSDLTNLYKTLFIILTVTAPSVTGIKSTAIAEIPRPRAINEPVTNRISVILSFLVAFDNIANVFAKGLNANPIIATDIEPSNIKGKNAGIPNIAIDAPSNNVRAAITPTCLKLTPFVASVIFCSATPNKYKAAPIIAIPIEPSIMVVNDLLIVLHA